MKLRSLDWFDGIVDATFEHRASMRAMGRIPESYIGKPIIGIFNSWNDFNNCNLPHKELVEYVKRGVFMSGGYPMEIHTITTPADFMKPSDLPYRNLMAMDVEEMIRSLPIDGVVLLCECDKTAPAQLMAAASCNLPTLQLAAGHRASAYFRGNPVNWGTDFWKYLDDYNSGKLTNLEWLELEKNISCSLGGCPVMGTASTMKCLSEILGMMLPGSSTIPANHSARMVAAEETGKRIVEMVTDDLRPSQLMTFSAFENAIKLLAAMGGSTNAIIHLIAIAGRLGLSLKLEDFSRLTQEIPLIVNLQPSGVFNMDQFHTAGGIGGAVHQLLPLLNGDCLTAYGKPIKEVYSQYKVNHSDVISSIEKPIKGESSFAVLLGNLAPEGAIIKKSASSPALWAHTGRAVVFESFEDLQARIDDEELDVDEHSVLVLKNCGPVALGMPEWGSIPIPKKLLRKGVRDMVRISDARMSGTSYGTIILHVAPEAVIGGPLAIVQNGDLIKIDISNGSIQLIVDEDIIQNRLSQLKRPKSPHKRGYMKIFEEQVLQAPLGCDLRSLRPLDQSETIMVPPIIGKS